MRECCQQVALISLACVNNSELDRMMGINKPKLRMGKSKPFQAGISRWLTGGLALCLLLLINFKSAATTTALWLAKLHGHGHQIVVQADGNHFDVRLSHDHDHNQPADHDHESSLGLIAALFSTHDHDGDDHVLHFNLSETPDQIRQRNIIAAAPTPAPPVTSAAISSFCPPAISPKSTAATLPESPPSLPAGMLGLRTTVLLI